MSNEDVDWLRLTLSESCAFQPLGTGYHTVIIIIIRRRNAVLYIRMVMVIVIVVVVIYYHYSVLQGST